MELNKITFQEAMQQATECLLDEHFPKTSQEINNGFCADWATIVSELFRNDGLRFHNDEEMTDGKCEYTHTFISYDGLYYDAEQQKGVKDWNKLPCFS